MTDIISVEPSQVNDTPSWWYRVSRNDYTIEKYRVFKVTEKTVSYYLKYNQVTAMTQDLSVVDTVVRETVKREKTDSGDYRWFNDFQLAKEFAIRNLTRTVIGLETTLNKMTAYLDIIKQDDFTLDETIQ